MSTTTATRKAAKVPDGNGLYFSDRWSWTVDELQRAYDAGVFGFDVRLELIEGEIIRKMPQNEPHSWGIRAAEEALRPIFVIGHDVRVQMPLVFGSRNKPEPDVAVVIGSYNDYKRAHPTTAVLVVEVSDSTLLMDRAAKAGVYARAGIPEYWIVNLPDRVLEIHRNPAPMADQPLGYHYRSITRHLETEIVTPLAASHAVVAIADLLP